MQVIIVGAGIAGLSTALALAQAGHKITVLESASTLAEIGAGVQLTPNTTRWLWKWGCASDILAISALPESFSVFDGIDGRRLGVVEFQEFPQRYGGPYLVIHRADIHRILHDRAVHAGVEFKLNSRVAQYLPDDGRLRLIDGTVHTADLVVAADGIKSHARQFLGENIPTGTLGNGLDRSGWAAFRLMAEVSQLAENEVTKELASSHRCNCFVGDETSVMTYKVKGADKLNLVLSHHDDVDTTDWTQEQYAEAITERLKEYSPDVRQLLKQAISNPNCTITNWPVHMVPSLPRWRSSSGRFVAIGDAAHAMPYFLSMGVSMATEDAAALAECLALSRTSNGKVGLADAMKLFEDVRKPRAEWVREASLHAGTVLHVPRGQSRGIRDAFLRDNGGPSSYSNNTSLEEVAQLVKGWRYGIIDNTIRDWCYGYDVVEDVRRHWDTRFGSH